MASRIRRTVLKGLSLALTGLAGVGRNHESYGQDVNLDQKNDRDFAEKIRRAIEADALEVDRLYSTKAIRFSFSGKKYSVPVNYFTAKGRDNPDAGESKGFGFFLFLPDFGGYTKDNWKDPFDKRLVRVLQLKAVDKFEIVKLTDGTNRRVSPANYGEPKARFELRRSRLETEPAFRLHGLQGYRHKGSGTPDVIWTGTRSNGEFFYFETPLAPDQPVRPHVYPTHPHCKVQYYSEVEDLFIFYIYSQDHIAKWKEIDDAIWGKIRGWRVS